MTGLTSHVLDTASSRPTVGVALRLKKNGAVLAAAPTKADGRCDSPLLASDAITAGAYRREFDVGARYHAADQIVVRL